MDGNGSTPIMAAKRGRALVSLPLFAAFALLVVALAASCGGASGSGGGQQPAGGDEQDAPVAEDQALGREPLGDANAPVVLTEYGDYQ